MEDPHANLGPPAGKKGLLTRPATLADVGRLAGVSSMAVSTVLNGARTSSRISAETRARIVAAAARLHYRPNAAARALANRRMKAFGVASVGVVEAGMDYYFLEIFNGMLEAAVENDESTTVFSLSDWPTAPERLRDLCDGRIDGMVLVAPLLASDVARRLPGHTPFVTVHANELLPGVPNVESDEEAGAQNLMRHLIGAGHRRILHITGPRGRLGPERRVRGYRRALAQARIRFDPELVCDGDFTERGGQRALRAWCARHGTEALPSAIFCGNDAMAIGCLEVMAEMGRRVPEDVSIAGFDDTVGARMTVPQLTTVRQPLRAMGRKAVELLLNRIAPQEGGAAAPDNVVLPVELVVRSSVAPLR